MILTESIYIILQNDIIMCYLMDCVRVTALSGHAGMCLNNHGPFGHL